MSAQTTHAAISRFTTYTPTIVRAHLSGSNPRSSISCDASKIEHVSEATLPENTFRGGEWQVWISVAKKNASETAGHSIERVVEVTGEVVEPA